jgi:hypothetical protein
MFRRRGKQLMVMLLAAGLVGAESSWAQMPGGAQAEGPEGMGPMRGFERLHKQLKLNPQQEELWKKAQAVQREVMQKTMAAGREQHGKLRAEIDQPGVDLKQFIQHMDQMREQVRVQMEATRGQVRAAWFAVYDALDAGQKEQVRVAISEGMDRMGRGHRGGRPAAEPRG